MSLKPRFIIEYDDIKGNETKIDILEDGYTGATKYLSGSSNPLNITMDGLDSKFTVVRGTGVDIEVKVKDEDGLKELYESPDMFKHPIKIYKNDVLFWSGYLNKEDYVQSYVSNINELLLISGNDGLVLLDRVKFLQNDGSKYEGFKTIWEIIQLSFDRIGFEYDYLYSSCFKYPKGVSSTTETPFHLVKVNLANYYDEEDEPITFRAVLEAVLKPFGLTLFITDNCINIVDVSYFANTTIKRQVYNSSFSYVKTECVDVNYNISNNDITFTGANQSISIINGYSEQIITYSPYGSDVIFESPDLDEVDSFDVSGLVWETTENTQRMTGVNSMSESVYLYPSCSVSTDYKYQLNGGGVYVPNLTTLEYYLVTQGANTGSKIFKNIDSLFYIPLENSALKFEFKAYIETKDDLYGEGDDEEKGTTIHYYTYRVIIKIGDKYLKFVDPDAFDQLYNPVFEWSDVESQVHFAYKYDSDKVINDQWLNVEQIIEYFEDVPKGKVEITYVDLGQIMSSNKGFINETSKVKRIRFKEFNILPVNKELSGIINPLASESPYVYTDLETDDLEYTGTMNSLFADEGSSIDLIHADSYNNNCTDRGGFLTTDLSFTELWYKDSETNNYPITSLLLRSIISNYRKSSDQISGTIKCSDLMCSSDRKNCFSFLSTISDTNYLDGKYMFMGGTYNDYEQSVEGAWIEIYQDDLTIEHL